MGNSGWTGPSLSFLLLNMKKKDVGQGPAFKNNCPATLDSGAKPMPETFMSYNKKSQSFARVSVLLITVENALKCPAGVLAGVPEESQFGCPLPLHLKDP